MNNKDLALYLRCSNVSSENRPRKCDQTCQYFVMEEVRDEFPCPPDLEADGKKYWTGCDYEQIAEDAAKYIESLETYNDQGGMNMTGRFMCTLDENNELHELKEEYSVTIYCGSEDETNRVAEKLENLHKYRWHDLRENPEDLPKEYETVQVWLKGRIVDIAVYCKGYGFIPWYSVVFEDCTPEWEKPVVAWKEIEPFEEES